MIPGSNDAQTTPSTSSDDPPAVRRAVILAAGKGNRLGQLTADVPKCMVEIGGEPLLERALRALASQGIAEAVIVVGYQAEAVRDGIGSSFAGVDISYVEAADYEKTNNIRSLWDARDYLDQDIMLLEADVVFDPAVIAALLMKSGSSAAVAPYHRALSGTVVRCDSQGRVASFTLGADQDQPFDATDAFKTVNIYLLRAELLRDEVVPRLCTEIEAGHVHEYYETILRDCVADGSLTDLAAIDVSASRWYEIDDHRDLDAAEFLFLDRDAQFDRVQQLHGSYWRYGFTDHSYLYNMHFPPTEMLEVFQGDLREMVTSYPVGQTELARLVADWTGVNPDHLVVANGAAELIKILGSQFVRRLTIPTPSFNEYEEVIAPDELNRFPLAPATFELDIDAFAESAIRWRSDAAVVITPNNPTAISVPRGEVLRLARRLEDQECRLIIDESFIEFSGAGAAGSVEEMVDAFPNLVVIKSMSKVFGIAGLRVGYLLSADREFVEAVRRCLPIWNVNGLAEEFLRTVGRFRREFSESCDLTRATCRELYLDLLAIPGIEPIEPDANFVLCKLVDPFATGPEIARRLYVEHDILVKDCAGKSMPEADRYLRIASRTPAENSRLVQALSRCLSHAMATRRPKEGMEASDAENAALMEHLERTLPPMDLGDAEKLLREVKQIFDEHGVVFFLRQGTCLGAVRDHALIPWDDDLDLGSIIGMHGFTESAIEPTVEELRANGCYVEVHRDGLYTAVKIMKHRIRIDWQCYRVVKGTIAHYPGVPFPASLFAELSEIDFIGDKYLVPSPPEEYLRCKYGPDWGTPKQAGYEKDVLDNMPEGAVPGRAGRLKQLLAVRFFSRWTGRLLVLNGNGDPVSGAGVLVAGLSRSRTNRKGYAKFYLPGPAHYAVAVTANGREEVLYEEALAPGKTYVYRPDPARSAGRYFVLAEE